MVDLIPSIIYEDSNILVINKPSGLVVNRANTVHGSTLMDWLADGGFISLPPRCSEGGKMSEFQSRLGVVHRLDKGTSGVMVVAKTKKAFENLQAQFKKRVVRKEYLALAHNKGSVPLGDGPQKSGYLQGSRKFVIDAPIGRNPRNRMKWAVVEGGRGAVTEFLIEYDFQFQNMATPNLGNVTKEIPLVPGGLGHYTLLRCFPKTGRTHQIRVHLASINCPVVCDKLYLSRREYKSDSKWCPRIFLHAEKIGFKHPESGEWVEYIAELPKELNNFIPKDI